MGRREEGRMERVRERYITAGVCVCVCVCAHQPPSQSYAEISRWTVVNQPHNQGSGSEMKDEGQIYNGGRCGDVKRLV